MSDLIQQITDDLQKQIESFEPQVGVSDIGTVLEAGDGIARGVHGLANVRDQELVQFSNGVIGTAFNLEKTASVSLLWAPAMRSAKAWRLCAPRGVSRGQRDYYRVGRSTVNSAFSKISF